MTSLPCLQAHDQHHCRVSDASPSWLLCSEVHASLKSPLNLQSMAQGSSWGLVGPAQPLLDTYFYTSPCLSYE